MWSSIPNVNEAIVNQSLEKYKQLAKQGKPIVHETKAEWTVLASIVMIHCRKSIYIICIYLHCFDVYVIYIHSQYQQG